MSICYTHLGAKDTFCKFAHLSSRCLPLIVINGNKNSACNQKYKEENLFFIEGARLSYDAAISGVVIKELFVTEKAAEKYSEKML